MQDWGHCASIENFVSEIPNLAYTRPLAASVKDSDTSKRPLTETKKSKPF